jgi:hypothetical protein
MNRTDSPHLRLVPRRKPSQRDKADIPPAEPKSEHEGGTDEQVGDRTGPAVGYDTDPEQVKDKGGVA